MLTKLEENLKTKLESILDGKDNISNLYRSKSKKIKKSIVMLVSGQRDLF